MAPRNGTILNPPKSTPCMAEVSISAINEDKKSHQVEERERFWEAYRACTEENRVAPDRSRYYLRWAKEFVDFFPGKRLKARTVKDIQAFLASLAQREGIAEWQVRQAEHALRILYEIFLPGYSPEKSPPAEPARRPDNQKMEEKPRMGFRDRVLPGEVERQFSVLVERFRTEMRT